MIITGYIDYSYIKSSNLPNKIQLNYKSSTLSSLYKIALKNNISLRKGTYVWSLGPTYETPAEIKDMISLGGDAVGMSTLPEIIKYAESFLRSKSYRMSLNELREKIKTIKIIST